MYLYIYIFLHQRGYPLVSCYITVENGPVEIVDLSIEHGVFPYLCHVSVPEGNNNPSTFANDA